MITRWVYVVVATERRHGLWDEGQMCPSNQNSFLHSRKVERGEKRTKDT